MLNSLEVGARVGRAVCLAGLLVDEWDQLLVEPNSEDGRDGR